MPTGADTDAGVLADDEEERGVTSGSNSETKVGVYMYGQHSRHDLDQPGMVANPTRDQLKRRKYIEIFLFPFALENLVSTISTLSSYKSNENNTRDTTTCTLL